MRAHVGARVGLRLVLKRYVTNTRGRAHMSWTLFKGDYL
jgi:hypothetical protein